MSNKKILAVIKRFSQLLELHGENEFKIRTYLNVIQRLEGVSQSICEMGEEDLLAIDGLGKTMASVVQEICQTGSFTALIELEEETPDGLIELLGFRGISAKRLRTVWQEFKVIDKHSFKALIESGKLLAVKGFGAKTIDNLAAIMEFAMECEGKTYYAEAEKIGRQIIDKILAAEPALQVSFVGKLRRKWEVIGSIELLVSTSLTQIQPILEKIELIEQDKKKSGPFSWRGVTTTSPMVEVMFYPSTQEKFSKDLMLKTGSQEHLNSMIEDLKFIDLIKSENFNSERDYYEKAGMQYCEPEIREGTWEVARALKNELPELIEEKHFRGILHNHTTYSDGQHSLREMADACRDLGYEYLGITDHSKAASFYANGLFEERVAQQQQEIDALNTEMTPFKIFKGIEADILADGALDYDSKTLASFDFVVASIHSGLTMDLKKATERLLNAIANPYTTMLGHMTGRILLQRQGYPVDHEAIINACAEFGVIIEINAHPKRLDIDWRWVRKALDKGLTLSINPDAHEIAGYKDMYYGLCVGRKGGLTKEQTFNTWSLKQVEDYFASRKKSI